MIPIYILRHMPPHNGHSYNIFKYIHLTLSLNGNKNHFKK